MMLDSPNYGSLDRFAFEPRRVEKPWGWELIWADADAYVGKVLFVRAGESLSLQFHREKDESWYVQSGRARLELGDGRPGGARRGDRHGRRVLPLPPRDGAPGHGARGHDDPRGLDAAPRRRRPARGPLRTRRHQRRLSGFCAGTAASTSATSAGCRSTAAARRRTASSCAPTAPPLLTDEGRRALVDYGVSLVVDLRPQREDDEDAMADLPVPVVRLAMDPAARGSRVGVAVDAGGLPRRSPTAIAPSSRRR